MFINRISETPKAMYRKNFIAKLKLTSFQSWNLLFSKKNNKVPPIVCLRWKQCLILFSKKKKNISTFMWSTKWSDSNSILKANHLNSFSIVEKISQKKMHAHIWKKKNPWSLIAADLGSTILLKLSDVALSNYLIPIGTDKQAERTYSDIFTRGSVDRLSNHK